MPQPPDTEPVSSLTRLARSWFELTRTEQRVLSLILALFLLGLATYGWHKSHESAAPPPPALTP